MFPKWTKTERAIKLAAVGPSVRNLAVVAVLASVLALAACATSTPSPQARATAEACSIFFHHYELKQIEMAATVGQRSGDAELAREAAQLQKDLAKPYVGAPALVDVVKMTDRCRQLGFS